MKTSPPPHAHKLAESTVGERIQTFILVVLFTALIWWTANQSVSVTRPFAVRLRLAKPPGMTLRLIGSDEFTLTLSGPQRQLDAFESRLRTRGDIVDYTPTEREARPAERVSWKAQDVFGTTPLLVGSGLSVADVTPREVRLSIDHLQTVEMSVVPDFGAMEVEGASVTPLTVRVTLPSRELAHHSRKLTPSAETLLANWRSEHADAQSFSINVPLAMPWVAERIEPPTVTVSGRLIQLLDTVTKGPIQILPSVPVSVQRKYVVEAAAAEDFRTDVSVRGPRDQLPALNAEQIRAYFDVLTADEGQAGQIITRKAVVVLPRGFELVSDPPEVRFRLVERDANGSTP